MPMLQLMRRTVWGALPPLLALGAAAKQVLVVRRHGSRELGGACCPRERKSHPG